MQERPPNDAIPYPILRWKQTMLSKGKDLRGIGNAKRHSTLKEALDVVNLHKGKAVFVVTRSPRGWLTFEYLNNSVCKVGFKGLDIAGLPLGGDPFAPQTYVIDGCDHFSHIVRTDDTYKLLKATRPTEEPTTKWAVNAVVPVKESNHSENISWSPKILLLPTLYDLKDTLAWVDQNLPVTTKVKAGGSKHSWS